MLRLKEIRKSNRQTTKEIADILGLTQSAYSNYENNNRKPPIDKLIILADHWKISLDELTGRSTNNAA